MAVYMSTEGREMNPSMRSPSVDCASIYIGNLDPGVTEELVLKIFSAVGSIQRCKLINQELGVPPYCFVDYEDQTTALKAIATMNGRKVLTKNIKVNWATSVSQGMRDTSDVHPIFVGDLSYDIESDNLRSAFEVFGKVTDARVVKDVLSGKSKGYGFVTFSSKLDAENAIKVMHGKMLGGRAIRTNWASRKGPQNSRRLGFEEISLQSSPFNSTLYIGGLPQGISDSKLMPYFQPFGQITDIRVFAEKGYAFVKYAAHEQATHAICEMNGALVEGFNVKCSWGKENSEVMAHQQQQQFHPYYQQYIQQQQRHQQHQQQQIQPQQQQQQQRQQKPQQPAAVTQYAEYLQYLQQQQQQQYLQQQQQQQYLSTLGQPPLYMSTQTQAQARPTPPPAYTLVTAQRPPSEYTVLTEQRPPSEYTLLAAQQPPSEYTLLTTQQPSEYTLLTTPQTYQPSSSRDQPYM